MKKVLYLDVLRYIACFFVVGIHTSGIDYDINIVANIYDTMFHNAVPIFVVISGAVNIGKNISFNKLWKKISYLVLSYMIWSTIYVVLYHLYHKDNLLEIGVVSIFKEIIKGHYHMWFIPMIIAIYILIPIIDYIYNNKNLFKYLLFIVFILSVVFQMVSKYKNVNNFIRNYFSESYLIYFLLGAYLKEIKIKKIYIPISLLIVIFITFMYVLNNSCNIKNIFTIWLGSAGHSTICSVVYVSAIFILIKGIFENKDNKFVLPEFTYGIYIIHPMVIKTLWTGFINIPTIREFAIIDVPINIILTFVVSLFVTFCMSKFRVLSKYLLLHKY